MEDPYHHSHGIVDPDISGSVIFAVRAGGASDAATCVSAGSEKELWDNAVVPMVSGQERIFMAWCAFIMRRATWHSDFILTVLM